MGLISKRKLEEIIAKYRRKGRKRPKTTTSMEDLGAQPKRFTFTDLGDDIDIVGVGKLSEQKRIVWIAGDEFEPGVREKNGKMVIYTPPVHSRINKKEAESLDEDQLFVKFAEEPSDLYYGVLAKAGIWIPTEGDCTSDVEGPTHGDTGYTYTDCGDYTHVVGVGKLGESGGIVLIAGDEFEPGVKEENGKMVVYIPTVRITFTKKEFDTLPDDQFYAKFIKEPSKLYFGVLSEAGIPFSPITDIGLVQEEVVEEDLSEMAEGAVQTGECGSSRMAEVVADCGYNVDEAGPCTSAI